MARTVQEGTNVKSTPVGHKPLRCKLVQQIVPLSRIGQISAGGLGRSRDSEDGHFPCGRSDEDEEDDLPAGVWNRIKDHPCYSEDAHHYFARMHVAVAPACNIQCHYCNRKYDCSNESRPGVVSEKLTPEQALEKVLAVAAQVPQLSVVGVAGPGDALADAEKTFRTFELVSKALPHLKLCLATNGLALPDHVDRIADCRIDHVTITINTVDPEIGAQINPWIFFDHRRWTGLDAARILHERQMEGLAALTAKGVLVKVNSVLIPGVNDKHLEAVNRAVRARGAFLHNIMPLISNPAHGTHYGLSGQREPTAAELKAVQDRLGTGARLMRHCHQCRADAVGLLGEDRGAEFAMAKLSGVPAYDPAQHEAYLSVVERERTDRRQARMKAEEALAASGNGPVRLAAVATKGGGRINLHFGRAGEFLIYEVDGQGARFVGYRRVDSYCRGGKGDAEALAGTIAALKGIDALLCAKIGQAPREKLAAAGIAATDAYAFEYIEASVVAWYLSLRQTEALAKTA
jgi:nitrogen fixation protein NifB